MSIIHAADWGIKADFLAGISFQMGVSMHDVMFTIDQI